MKQLNPINEVLLDSSVLDLEKELTSRNIEIEKKMIEE